MEMSITRGLAELKLLDKRISKAINDGTYIGFQVGSQPVYGYEKNEDFNDKAKESLQSVKDLIKRRNNIKSAIVQANATTMVKIGNQEMTIASAIERKNSIGLEKMLLQRLVSCLNGTDYEVSKHNVGVQARLEKLLEASFSKDAKIKTEEMENISKPFLEKHEAKIVDPLKLKEVIEKLSKEIDEFECEVDHVLSEINTITKIEIPE